MNCSRNLLLQTFFKKTELKGVTNTKTQKTDIFELEWLHGVHPTAESGCAVCITPWSQEIKISQKAPQWDVHRGLESSSAMCITTQSQTVHRRVKASNFYSAVCKTFEFFELCDRISRRNRTEFENTLTCFQGLGRFESWKRIKVKNLVTHSL